jgi:diaminohydroxyphosphoribosylaminopyrimidine deaminase / 5-amino-6-(5-phosphoribosylamino)uracil reductase
MEVHNVFMNRCIQISKNGLVAAMPNPSVGAVIVVDGVIVSEGYTSEFGGSHAEVNAINAISNKEILKKATLYVSLEPCSHFGKTPPCADLIIKHKIQKVVVGALDPNKIVSGRGIEKLKNAGIV